MIEEPPFRNRIADVYAILEARERRRKRAIAGGATVLLLLLACALYGIIYFTFIGSQHHVLQIQIGEATYRIESHRGPFSVEVPGEDPALPIAAGNGGFLTEHLALRRVIPRTYLWSPIAETSQIVKLPRRKRSCEFTVNGIPFHATAQRLRTGGRSRVAFREWLSRPGAIETIDVDRLVEERDRR
jgi:hypothetical protein